MGESPRQFISLIYASWVSNEGISLTCWDKRIFIDGSRVQPEDTWSEFSLDIPAVATAGGNGKAYYSVALTGNFMFGSVSVNGADGVSAFKYSNDREEWLEAFTAGAIDGWK